MKRVVLYISASMGAMEDGTLAVGGRLVGASLASLVKVRTSAAARPVAVISVNHGAAAVAPGAIEVWTAVIKVRTAVAEMRSSAAEVGGEFYDFERRATPWHLGNFAVIQARNEPFLGYN